jgi:hypothetical protein
MGRTGLLWHCKAMHDISALSAAHLLPSSTKKALKFESRTIMTFPVLQELNPGKNFFSDFSSQSLLH